MTMTLERPRENVRESAHFLQWRAHQAGVWLAYQSHRFVGMVEESWGNGFTATTRLGRTVGQFPTLGQAKSALESAAVESSL